MDTSPPPFITRLQVVRTASKSVLQDLSKPFLRVQFLQRTCSVLTSLYGPNAQIVQKYRNAVKNSRNLSFEEINGLIIEFDHILNSLETFSGQDTINPTSRASAPPAGRNVFIIHGHDEINALRLRGLLQDYFKLNPILMKKEAGMSSALLKKFKDVAASCSFAFALLTPDDKVINGTNSYSQARPNVIFEAGWFVGRLGIPHVCLLLKDGTYVHSDIDGISRIGFRDNIEEKVIDIQKELQAVGIIK